MYIYTHKSRSRASLIGTRTLRSQRVVGRQWISLSHTFSDVSLSRPVCACKHTHTHTHTHPRARTHTGDQCLHTFSCTRTCVTHTRPAWLHAPSRSGNWVRRLWEADKVQSELRRVSCGGRSLSRFWSTLITCVCVCVCVCVC